VCWGFVAGKGTGSVVELNLGKKVSRKSAVKNPHLTDEQQASDSEFALLVECTWRLESKTQVICGAWDDNSKQGAMIKGLERLVGQTIESISLLRPSLDLELSFSNQLVLRIFCDLTNRAEMVDNYSFFLPRMIYIVGTRSRLRKEVRKSK
jgi:hypothetical protein